MHVTKRDATSAKPKRRALKETYAAIHPVTVSQETCREVLGCDDRRYLEKVREHASELRPVRIGRLVVVRVSAWLALIERLGAEGHDVDELAVPPPANDQQPETADDVLAALGRRRA